MRTEPTRANVIVIPKASANSFPEKKAKKKNKRRKGEREGGEVIRIKGMKEKKKIEG